MKSSLKLGVIVLCNLATFVLLGCVTTQPIITEPIQKIIDLNGISSSTIFTKSQLWASKTFVSAKDAIEISDKDAGIITIRTTFQSYAYKIGIALGASYYTTYKVVIEIKENRVRITCQNPTYEVINQGRIQKFSTPTQAMVDEYEYNATSIINSFEAFLKSSATSW
ncbi:MAG: DUF4468 domain-containing protein [Caldisericales bacterium]|jgi:hypothetical protein|nr:DUF4468 domain-containing protein [Caldisericales bacterium]